MNKISAVYQIINTVTNDRYVGSSKDVKRRWREHKRHSRWKRYSNSLLYQDMQKYGVDKFRFQILAPVMPEYLTRVEQELIDMLQPTYNDKRANGFDVERQKEYQKKYNQSTKRKEYYQSDKSKENHIKSNRKYQNQICSYNGEIIKLGALATRFRRAGVEHPTIEAKKYLKNI